MSAKSIESTLPQMKEAVKAIMQEHNNEKGIIGLFSTGMETEY